jgi:hypothetical protein
VTGDPLHYTDAEVAEGAGGDPLAGLKEAVGRADADDRPAAAVRAVQALARTGIDPATRAAVRAYVKKEKLIEPLSEFDRITARPGHARTTGSPPARPTVPPPDDPAALLDELHGWLTAYVAFPSEHAPVAVVLWIAHTHLVGSFGSTPRLALLSPEKECGKTRVLELLELVCAGAEMLSGASPAYLFRRIGDPGLGPVTLLLDEADAIWKRGKSDDTAEALRSIVDAGHRKGASVGRVEMNSHGATLLRFPVFAPAALAAIRDLPDTIVSRAVVIHMRRRAPGHKISPYRERTTRPEGEALRDQLAAWAADAAKRVGDPWPDMPPGVDDRPGDVWEPLLMAADLAGGHWPGLAREACVALVKGARDDSQTTGTRLLADLREILTAQAAEPEMWTSALLAKLHANEEAPWGDWYGHPLTARELANRLRPHGITSTQVRKGDVNRHGYRRADFEDAWARYLPPPSATAATSATCLARDVADVALVADTPPRCAVCGEPIDTALADAGYATHPGCDPEERW